MTAQSKVEVTAATARNRLETARQTNDPANLRAAVDEALLALNALLAATGPCRQAPAAGGVDHAGMPMPQPATTVSGRPPITAADPHAGHAMPTTPAKPSIPSAATKPDAHAGMKMPAAPAKAGAKPAAKPADPHAGMKMPAVVFSDDPKNLVCAPAIDPDDAPATKYKAKTYYFCTTAERLRFLTNPETYLKSKGPGK